MSTDLGPRTSTPPAAALPRDQVIVASLSKQGGRASFAFLLETTQIPRSALFRQLNKLVAAGTIRYESGFANLVSPTGVGQGGTGTGTRGTGTGKNPTSPTVSHPESHSPIPPVFSSVVPVVVETVTGVGLGLGIPETVLEELMATHGQDAVRHQLRHLGLAKRFGPKPITHPVAWIKAALEGRWEPATELLAAAKHAEATRVLEASQEAARASRRRTIEVDAKAQDRLAALSEEQRDNLLAKAVVTDLPPCLARLLPKAILIDQTQIP